MKLRGLVVRREARNERHAAFVRRGDTPFHTKGATAETPSPVAQSGAYKAVSRSFLALPPHYKVRIPLQP